MSFLIGGLKKLLVEINEIFLYDVPQPFGDIYPARVALATGAKGLWYIKF